MAGARLSSESRRRNACCGVSEPRSAASALTVAAWLRGTSTGEHMVLRRCRMSSALCAPAALLMSGGLSLGSSSERLRAMSCRCESAKPLDGRKHRPHPPLPFLILPVVKWQTPRKTFQRWYARLLKPRHLELI